MQFMTHVERGYFKDRADDEFSLARLSSHTEAAAIHRQLAEAYIERVARDVDAPKGLSKVQFPSLRPDDRDPLQAVRSDQSR